MAKKKTTIKKAGTKKGLKKKRGLESLPQDATAFVVFEDATVTGGGGFFDPLVVSTIASAKDCSGTPTSLTNFTFKANFNGYETSGAPEDPNATSSKVLFYFPSWAGSPPGLTADGLAVTVLTKKKVKVQRA
jgi:hypothetical protein